MSLRWRPAPPMKWARHPNLRKRPRKPAKGRGSVQRAIRRAFAASGTEALTSSAIYDWAHIRRRLGRRKSMPFGIYSRTLRTLRAMCDPIERVPPHGAWSQAGHAERAPYAGRRDTRTAAPTARAGPEPAHLRLRARRPDEPQELRYAVRTPGRARRHGLPDPSAHAQTRMWLRPG